MSYLRHPSRQVLRTVATTVKEQLDVLGWMDADETPAGAAAIDFKTGFTLPWQRASIFKPGLVTCTLGDSVPEQEQELGGPLTMLMVPIFFDVVMAADAHAMMVADDIKDILRGQRPDTSRFVHVTDYGQDPAAVTDWVIELDDVVRLRPDHEMQVHWQVVKVTANTYYNEAVFVPDEEEEP